MYDFHCPTDKTLVVKCFAQEYNVTSFIGRDSNDSLSLRHGTAPCSFCGFDLRFLKAANLGHANGRPCNVRGAM